MKLTDSSDAPARIFTSNSEMEVERTRPPGSYTAIAGTDSFAHSRGLTSGATAKGLS